MSDYLAKSQRTYTKRPDSATRCEEPAIHLPEQFVDEARKIMQEKNLRITTSKIRKLLSLATDICYNQNNQDNQESSRTKSTPPTDKLPADKLRSDILHQIQLMRIRLVYEAGRDPDVRVFISQSHLIGYLKDIGESREKLVHYTQYLEALVAYHRFFGGREN